MRKVVQIACAESSDGEGSDGTLYALADDGSMWIMLKPWAKEKRRWDRLPDLPGGPRLTHAPT